MTWASRTSPVQVGDRVAYSSAFLRSIGEVTGDLPFARGVVTGLDRLGDVTLAVVEWGNEEIPERVNVKNLEAIKARGVAAE